MFVSGFLCFSIFNFVFQILSSTHPLEEVYESLRNLSIDYVVVDQAYCYGRIGTKCTMKQIWNVEDERVGYWKRRQAKPTSVTVCHRLLNEQQFGLTDDDDEEEEEEEEEKEDNDGYVDEHNRIMERSNLFRLVFHNQLYSIFRLIQ